MEIKDSTYIHHGDIIENGGLKIVYGDESSAKKKAQEEKPLTMEELKKKCDFVRPRIGTTKKLWFSVCCYLMWRKNVTMGDFKEAVRILQELYPDLKLDPHDLKSYYVLSFTKPLDEWDPQNAPVQGTTYNKYYTIAEMMYAV